MKKPFKIAAVVFGVLVLILVGVALSGCASGERPAPVVPANPATDVVQPAGKNRSLGELLSIARGDLPEPANLSVADRNVLAKMRSARR